MGFQCDYLKTTNIVPFSTTQLAYSDYEYAEANISKGVTSGVSHPSSMLLNISSFEKQRFKLVSFSDFMLVRQPYTLNPYPIRIFHDPLRGFPLRMIVLCKKGIYAFLLQIKVSCGGLYPTPEGGGFYAAFYKLQIVRT